MLGIGEGDARYKRKGDTKYCKGNKQKGSERFRGICLPNVHYIEQYKKRRLPHWIVAPRLMIEIRFNPCSRAYAPNDQALSYAYEYSLALPQHTRYL